MQLPTMPKKLPTFAKFNQMSKKHRITAAGAVAAAAVVLTVTGLEATAGAGSATAAGSPTGISASAAAHSAPVYTPAGKAAPSTTLGDATQKKQDVADAAKKTADTGTAKKAAADRAKDKSAANRSTKRVVLAAPKKAHAAAPKKVHTVAPKKVHTVAPHKVKAVAPKKAVKTYTDNLDGWIRHSLDIMHSKGIPGTYEGIHRNIIRESSGNPKAINLWDINARNGIPSKGLLQVINPTFDRYHVAGTSHNIYDPVANITAACNYAADRYGTMDNVDSAY